MKLIIIELYMVVKRFPNIDFKNMIGFIVKMKKGGIRWATVFCIPNYNFLNFLKIQNFF